MADINRRTTQVNGIRAILEYTQGQNLPVATIERVEQYLENLDTIFAHFLATTDRLIAGNIPQNEFDEHERLRALVQQQHDDARVALIQRRNEINRAAVAAQPPPPPQAVQQPAIHIDGIDQLLAQKIENSWGKFDGTIWKWPSFRDLFGAAIHNHPTLVGSQKFRHLKKSLTGPAAEALGNWLETDQNYALAYERLERLYDKPHQAACELLDRLTGLEKIKGTGHELQNLSNVANEVKHHLQGLGHNIQHSDIFFIQQLQMKLDAKTKEEWEIKRGQNVPTLEQLLRFLEERASALGYGTLEKSNPKEHNENKKRFGDKQSRYHPYQKPEQKNNNEHSRRPTTTTVNCAFCNNSHLTRMCNKYLAKDRLGREKMVKDKSLCRNCLLEGHFARNCRAGACSRCSEKHNSTICPASPFFSKTNQVSSQSEKKQIKKEQKKSDES